MKRKSIKFLLFMLITFANSIYSYDYDHLQKVLKFANSTDRTDRNLRCLNLSGAPLKGLDLSGGDFTGTNFEKANLMHTRWDNPDFNNEEDGYTNLSFAKLSGARLNYAQMNKTLMLHVFAQGTIFNGAKLYKINSAYGNFDGAKFPYAEFYKTNVAHANFDNTDLRNCKLIEIKLEKTARRNNVKFEGTSWIRTLIEPINDSQSLQQTIRIKGTSEANSLENAIRYIRINNLTFSLAATRAMAQSTEQPVEIRNFCNNDMPMPTKIHHDSKCPICQEDFNEFERIGITFCGHLFHQDCINQTLSRTPGTCPICRTPGITRFRSLAYMPNT